MKTNYDPVAVTLHWLIAFAIIVMIPMGFFMGDFPINIKFTTYGIHKSIGLLVLTLSIFRLIWRLLNPPPALPETMPAWEKLAANLSHIGLYFLMIAMPLTGYLTVSASKKYPTVFFGLGEVPFIPLPESWINKAQAHEFKEYHELLAYGAILLVTLHIAAALKHHFVNHDSVLVLMLPSFRRNRHA